MSAGHLGEVFSSGQDVLGLRRQPQGFRNGLGNGCRYHGREVCHFSCRGGGLAKVIYVPEAWHDVSQGESVLHEVDGGDPKLSLGQVSPQAMGIYSFWEENKGPEVVDLGPGVNQQAFNASSDKETVVNDGFLEPLEASSRSLEGGPRARNGLRFVVQLFHQ
jgi:hypothetical protein